MPWYRIGDNAHAEIRTTHEANVPELLRYATTVVTIGVDPDNPHKGRVDIVPVPGNMPICFATQAAMLRTIADQLDALHAPRCGGALHKTIRDADRG